MQTKTETYAKKPWNFTEMNQLKKMAQKDTPTHIISKMLKRDIENIRKKAARLRIRLYN